MPLVRLVHSAWLGETQDGQHCLGWSEVSSYFGESLELFAKGNYELILARRK